MRSSCAVKPACARTAEEDRAAAAWRRGGPAAVADRRGRLALGGLVEDELDASAGLDDANLEEARAEIDADDSCGRALDQKEGSQVGAPHSKRCSTQLLQASWTETGDPRADSK